jgi:4-alpha-glucanotransferase
VRAPGISLGAPGDAANPDGQRWNLLPLRPDRFNDGDAAVRAFRAMRSIMTHAGGRMGHVLGLSRNFWIHKTQRVAISYPFTRLMRV